MAILVLSKTQSFLSSLKKRFLFFMVAIFLISFYGKRAESCLTQIYYKELVSQGNNLITRLQSVDCNGASEFLIELDQLIERSDEETEEMRSLYQHLRKQKVEFYL